MTTFQIFNADCLQKMKDISANSINLILCDLPYGCLTTKGVETCTWDIPLAHATQEKQPEN